MPRSECMCDLASCEASMPGFRFMMVKKDGVITNKVVFRGQEYKSGHTENDIDHCEMKCRVSYRDKEGTHQPCKPDWRVNLREKFDFTPTEVV